MLAEVAAALRGAEVAAAEHSQVVERMNTDTLALMEEAKRKKGAADAQHAALLQVRSVESCHGDRHTTHCHLSQTFCLKRCADSMLDCFILPAHVKRFDSQIPSFPPFSRKKH